MSRSLRVAIVGAGYLGLVSAACLARLGHRVSVLETAPARLDALANGRSSFYEPGLEELLTAAWSAGRLTASGDPAEAFDGADLIMVCVGTPLDAGGLADMRQVQAACAAIREHAPQTPVVIRSTLPPGISAALMAWLGAQTADRLATNPEFLRQGSAVEDFLAPSRIVIGTPDGHDNDASHALRRLFEGIPAPTLLTDLASAEIIKNAANAFLAVKLSFVNELADLCEAFGGDVERVVAGIGLDPRIGRDYLRPGIGFGGSCLTKELANLVRLAGERGLPANVLRGAAATNAGRAEGIVARLERWLGPLDGRRVGLLGLTFKAGTDDLRDSPALVLAHALTGRGASLRAHDPVAPARHPALDGLQRVSRPEEAFEGADLVVHATEWPMYRNLDWGALARRVRRRVVFDGRNALDAEALRAGGWDVLRVGQADLAVAGSRPPGPDRARSMTDADVGPVTAPLAASRRSRGRDR